ncbi:MAG: hypothetical protein DMG18_10890 [Acidobacteria bacterium]|nr:MAG: hypothetical protein DMG18_10890 [Acidobacteriota bacterium]
MKFKAVCDAASLSLWERSAAEGGRVRVSRFGYLLVVNFFPQDWAVDGQFIDLDQAEIGHA